MPCRRIGVLTDIPIHLEFFTGDTSKWVLVSRSHRDGLRAALMPPPIPRQNEEEALPIIKAAYDVGINFWDTWVHRMVSL